MGPSPEPSVASGLEREVGGTVVHLTPLWALKAVYCIGTGSSSCLWKYITVFYHHVGLSNSQMGLVQMLNPTVCFAAQLGWAMLCDWLGSYKEVLVGSTGMGIITICLLLLPSVQARFAAICLVTLAASAFMASRGSLNDSMTLQVVQDYKDAQRRAELNGRSFRRLPSYGQQRLWGAAGWGIGSLLGGLLMDVFGVPFMFVSFSCLLVLCIGIIATQFPARRAQRMPRADAGTVVAQSFSSFEVLWFFANLFVYGLCMALVETFLFVFMLREFQGTSRFLLGGTVAVMCLFEVPVFFFADRLIARVQLTNVLSACHFVFALRCLLYSVLPRAHPATVLLVEPLHGLTFAMMWCAAVEYGKRLAPPGAQARMQALTNGLYYQLAIGLGSLLWGPITEAPPRGLGFTTAYRLAAAVIIAWSATWNFGWWLQSRRSGVGAPSACVQQPQQPQQQLLQGAGASAPSVGTGG